MQVSSIFFFLREDVLLVYILPTRRRKHFVGDIACEMFKRYFLWNLIRLISMESCEETSPLYREFSF